MTHPFYHLEHIRAYMVLMRYPLIVGTRSSTKSSTKLNLTILETHVLDLRAKFSCFFSNVLLKESIYCISLPYSNEIGYVLMSSFLGLFSLLFDIESSYFLIYHLTYFKHDDIILQMVYPFTNACFCKSKIS